MPVIGQRPPEAGRPQRNAHVVVGNDKRVIPDPQTTHDFGELVRLYKHVRDRVAWIGKLTDHADEHSAWNVVGKVALMIAKANPATVFVA